MGENKIKPALTPEGWAYAIAAGEHGRGYDVVFEDLEPFLCHYIAALALNGQPFGFTWEDIEQLRHGGCDWDDQVHLSDIADRIEALLPPRPNHG